MANHRFERTYVEEIALALQRKKGLIHVIVGPRQVGKTTAAEQIGARWRGEVIFASVDQMLPPKPEWIESQWLRARQAARQKPVLLVLDEIQKVHKWSETVKAYVDEDVRLKHRIVPLILGSSALLLQEGLSESLAGRFALHRFPHWTWPECEKAFGWTLEEWLFFGGYPGAARFRRDEKFWQNYIADSLIETAITRDVLQNQKITKPTLLRHLFAFACHYPAQIFSYNKMLGQLQDAGNTTTLAHYLKLLETAFLISGLEGFKRGIKRKRGSSPKLILWNNALVNAFSGKHYAEARKDSSWWGRLVENAVGAYLLNHLQGVRYEITYWRESNDEVDFVLQVGNQVWAIEVKSGRIEKPSGTGAFKERFPDSRALIVGSGGYPLEEFFKTDPKTIFI